MSVRIGLKLQRLETLKRNGTRILTLFTINFEFTNNFSVFQYSTPDSHFYHFFTTWLLDME